MTISDNLKRIRLEKDLKQEEVAQSLGISRSTYTNFENGRDPDIKLLIKLADLYKMSLDDLVGRKFKRAPTVIEDDSVSDNHETNDFDEEFDPKFIWRSSLKSRKTYSALLFMLYLLKMANAEEIRNSSEDILQSVIYYVIRSFYKGINFSPYDIRETQRLLSDLYAKLMELADNVSHDFFNEMGPIKDNYIFKVADIKDYGIVEKYFNVDLSKILDSNDLIGDECQE